MITKDFLDNLVYKYEVVDFIKDDPVQFPNRYTDKRDVEIAGFLASLFAYGKREVFIEKLSYLFDLMGSSPYNFVLNFDENSSELLNFNYRFSVGIDLVQVLKILKTLYSEGYSLEELFARGWDQFGCVQEMLQYVVDYFYARVNLPITAGFYHLLPNPSKGSACKRLNMFLRWMIRDGAVDLGVWDFMPKSELLIPLDVHVAKISRSLGLLQRKQNDYCSVLELTTSLKKFDSIDPVKYDFAMFGLGVNDDL